MMPVADLNATTSYAEQNPGEATVVILAFLLVAVGFYWVTKKYPRLQGTVRLVGFATIVALAGWVNWGMFKPQPSFMSQLETAVQQYQNVMENGIEMAMFNSKETLVPGERVTFVEVQGGKCDYSGVVQAAGNVAIDRKLCADGTLTIVNMAVPLNKGPVGANGQKHYKAFPVADSEQRESNR